MLGGQQDVAVGIVDVERAGRLLRDDSHRRHRRQTQPAAIGRQLRRELGERRLLRLAPQGQPHRLLRPQQVAPVIVLVDKTQLHPSFLRDDVRHIGPYQRQQCLGVAGDLVP